MTAATAMAESEPTAESEEDDKQPLQESALEANTATEFMAMLRQILHASKMSAGQVSTLAKLPRSTAYRFVDPKNTTLPSRPEQVERFVRACRLRDDQIARVMRIWHKLKGTPEPDGDGEQDTTTVASHHKDGTLAHIPGFSWDPPSEGMHYDPQAGKTQRLVARGLSRSDYMRARHIGMTSLFDPDVPTRELRQLLNELTWSTADAKRSKGTPVPPNVIVINHSREPARLIAGEQAPVWSWPFRRQVLVLLAMAVLPMVLRGIFGPPEQTILVHVLTFALAAIALVLLSQLGRTGVAPCPARLAVAAGIGGTAAGLAWWATDWPFLALASGFLVFMAVPMWLAVMDGRWTGLFTSSRGVFAVVLAIWFATLTGVFLTTANGLIAATLGGVLTGAGVLMEAATRIMPPPRCPECGTLDTTDPDKP
ncbi:hypothetical protein IU501_35420 [Nocardia otitidiscaviarum]|uniref:hypothetical protein n=1 Tax=Nocardia otitidiscaviarum TaxID=1823 RepID=UPI00189421A3|nr:hypothetical protein [Nocardia otitidiscaviarum]MBF6138265.1 hypothetical protein [Nocardia otitidiscaviarum]